jgi:putative ATP-binding cassette transporter
MQLASAFAQVQAAIGWLVDNYWRLAEWFASARRVTELVDALEGDGAAAAVSMGSSADGMIHVEGLRLTDFSGRVLLARADAVLLPGERVIVTGDPGTGKSTLVRALAGLWPWGSGAIRLPAGATLAFVPPYPYLPPGSLAETVAYPNGRDSIRPEELAAALDRCGLVHLATRAAEVRRWDLVLSSGERQRLGLARLMVQRPDIVVMDEVAAGLDDGLTDIFADLLQRELAHSTVVMVGQRTTLARFAGRRLVLRAGPRGATLHDEIVAAGQTTTVASASVIHMKPTMRDMPR